MIWCVYINLRFSVYIIQWEFIAKILSRTGFTCSCRIIAIARFARLKEFYDLVNEYQSVYVLRGCGVASWILEGLLTRWRFWFVSEGGENWIGRLNRVSVWKWRKWRNSILFAVITVQVFAIRLFRLGLRCGHHALCLRVFQILRRAFRIIILKVYDGVAAFFPGPGVSNPRFLEIKLDHADAGERSGVERLKSRQFFSWGGSMY